MPRLATDLTDHEASMLRHLLEDAPIGEYGIIIAKLLPLLPEVSISGETPCSKVFSVFADPRARCQECGFKIALHRSKPGQGRTEYAEEFDPEFMG